MGGEPEEFVPDNLLSELKEPMCQYVGDETVAWVAPDKQLQIVAECWEPVGFMKCFTAEFQRDVMAKVIADTSGRYFKSGVDPIAAREHEEEPAPAVTRAAVAAGGGAELGGQRALKAGGCLRAKLEGKLVYLRLDKQAKRSGLWSVGVCNKSREQSGGEKPRATTVLKMTRDEIRAAVSAAAADDDEPAV